MVMDIGIQIVGTSEEKFSVFGCLPKQFKGQYQIDTNEIADSYNSLLNKWINLSRELELENSLELSIFFTYLFWNGYFSLKKLRNFQAETKEIALNLLPFDVSKRNSIILISNKMLNDFLTMSGYSSTTIFTGVSNIKRDNNAIETIQTNSNNKKNSMNSSSVLPNFLNYKNRNHCCTLIYEENSGLYVYDLANLICAKVIDKNIASVIDGTGLIILKPILNSLSPNSESEMIALSKLFDNDFYNNAPYDKEDIIDSWRHCADLFYREHYLIKACYLETIADILGISEKLGVCKKKLKI